VTEPSRRHAGRCTKMSPGLCSSCARLVGDWLAELPGLVALLSDGPAEPCCHAHSAVPLPVAANVRVGTGERVSGSGETPLPGGTDRLTALCQAADVHAVEWVHRSDAERQGDAECQTGAVPVAAVLAVWACRAAEEFSVHPPAVGRVTAGPLGLVRRTSASDVPALCRFLSRWHDDITWQPWSDDYAVELHDVWVRCKAMAGVFDGKPEPCDGVPCPFCDRVALNRLPGLDGRRCLPEDGGCGRWLPDVEYGRWTRLQVHSAKEAIPVTKTVRSKGETVVVQQVAANGRSLSVYDCLEFAAALAEVEVPQNVRVEVGRDPNTYHATSLRARHTVVVPVEDRAVSA
jgi:hypothetical protein